MKHIRNSCKYWTWKQETTPKS